MRLDDLLVAQIDSAVEASDEVVEGAIAEKISIEKSLERLERHKKATESPHPPEKAQHDMSFQGFVDSLGVVGFTGKEASIVHVRETASGVKNHVPEKQFWFGMGLQIIADAELRVEAETRLRWNSLYRYTPYNTAIGGASLSQHRVARASDKVPLDVSLYQLRMAIRRLRERWISIPNVDAFKGLDKPISHFGEYLNIGAFKLDLSQGRFKYVGGIGKYNSFVHGDIRGKNVNF